MYKSHKINISEKGKSIIKKFYNIIEMQYVQNIIKQKLGDNCINIIIECMKDKNDYNGFGCKIFVYYVAYINNFLSESYNQNFITAENVVDALYDLIFSLLDNYYDEIIKYEKNIWDYYPIVIVKDYFDTDENTAFLVLENIKHMVMFSYNDAEDISFIPYNNYFDELELHEKVAIQSYIGSKKQKYLRLLCNNCFSIINDSLLLIYSNKQLFNTFDTISKIDNLEISLKKVWFKCIIFHIKNLH